jgi:hypothetical protein
MKSSKVLLVASLIGLLSSIQGINAFSLSGFFSGFSTIFSRIKPTYDQDKPYYGLNSRENIPHAIAAGSLMIFPGFLLMRAFQSKQSRQTLPTTTSTATSQRTQASPQTPQTPQKPQKQQEINHT